jgi:hypothetical protein
LWKTDSAGKCDTGFFTLILLITMNAAAPDGASPRRINDPIKKLEKKRLITPFLRRASERP